MHIGPITHLEIDGQDVTHCIQREEPWTISHELHVVAQTERKPNPTTGWWEIRPTGLVHLTCACGYSSGWINKDDMPGLTQLTAEHGAPTAVPATPRTPEQHEAFVHWLTANGIDPDVVPLDSEITIEQDPATGQRYIKHTAFLLDHGRKYVDLTTGDAAQEQRAVLLKVEPTANMQVTGSN